MFHACKLFFFPSLRVTAPTPPSAVPPLTVCQDVCRPRNVEAGPAPTPAPQAPRKDDVSNGNACTGAKAPAFQTPELDDDEYYFSPEELDLCLF